MLNSNEILVDMASFSFGSSPQILLARGLGSCVAISFYNQKRKIGALCHAMLPDSHESTIQGSPMHFIDKIIAQVLANFELKQVKPNEIEAKIIGGSNMFPFLHEEVKIAPAMGERNVAMAKALLKEHGVVVIGQDVGGNYGRSVRFNLDTGIVTVEKKI